MIRKNTVYVLFCLFLLFWSCSENDKLSKQSSMDYPITPKKSDSVNYFGTLVEDPYSWLEKDTAKEVENWVKTQNEFTQNYLNKLSSTAIFKEKLTQLMNYPRMGIPFWAGDFLFYTKNNGLENQAVIYQQDKKGQESVFINPNELSADGSTSVAVLSASEDGKYIAISSNKSGSDWAEITIRNLTNGETLKDVVKKVKFSDVSWYKDGFFYSAFPNFEDNSAKNEFHSVYYHKLGTHQISDLLIYQNKTAPHVYHQALVTLNSEYLVINAQNGTEGNAILIQKTEHLQDTGKLKVLLEGFESKHQFIDYKQGKFYVLTNYNAPNYQLVAIDPEQTQTEYWQIVIPEKSSILQTVTIGFDRLFARYLENVQSKIYSFNYQGMDKKIIPLPDLGVVNGFSGKTKDKEVYFSYSSLLEPPTIYRYTIEKNEVSTFFTPKISFDTSLYLYYQNWYTGKDGTKIPLFIVHRKDLQRAGNHPTLLYGYGGFNISVQPNFNPYIIPFLEKGGVYVIANIRGGGEFGENWHQQGMLLKKQNVFDDFIAAAEYLIQQKYTSKKHLAIQGGSNGGLLVGAVMTQRPDLFKVAFPMVGVLDMLKYHQFTVGWGWVPEYGSATQNKEMFNYLYRYSPYHALKSDIHYPATLVTTADHDDRVVPAHSFKFIARLQALQAGKNPVLIAIQTKAGHGAGKSTTKLIQEAAERWAFLFENIQ